MVPKELLYTKDHEWVRRETDGTATIGITDFAQKQLGDVVFVELPKSGDKLDGNDPFGTVESVKAVSELFMPVGGTITSVNDGLSEDPELVNTDPYGDGWMVTVRPANPKELDALLSAAEYEDFLKQDAE